jgi:hypothetical protein
LLFANPHLLTQLGVFALREQFVNSSLCLGDLAKTA